MLQLAGMGQPVLVLAAFGAGWAKVDVDFPKAVVFVHNEKDPLDIHRRHQQVVHRPSRRGVGLLRLALGQHQHLAFNIQRDEVGFGVGGRHLRHKAPLAAAQLQRHRLRPGKLLRPPAPQPLRLVNVIFPGRQFGARLRVITDPHSPFPFAVSFRSQVRFLAFSETNPSPSTSFTLVVIRNAWGSHCLISSRRRGYSLLRTAHSTTLRSAPL